MKNQIVLLLLILTTPVFAQAPTNGLIAYYPFNGNAKDVSGNNNHGAIYGTVNTVSDHNGNANGAFQFTEGSKIRIANSSSLNLTDGFSYSAWVRLRSFAGRDGNTGAWSDYGSHAIFSKNCDHDYLSAVLITLNDNSLRHTGGTWYGGWLSYYFNYTAGNWLYLTMTYEATTHSISILVNGKLIAIAIANINFASTNSADLIIGGMDCWNFFFNGDMDELRFYNRRLTEQEVAIAYEYEKAPIVSVNNGAWEDTSVWSCNCIPTPTDVVQVKHAINIPANTAGYAWNVQYSNGGKVTLSSEARLVLSK